jgi:hypothetical protein
MHSGLAAHSGALTANSLSILHTNNGANGAGGRFNNAIMYSSPNWGGFAFNLGYSTTAGAWRTKSTDRCCGQGTQRLDQPALHQRPDPRRSIRYLKRDDVGSAAAGTSPDAEVQPCWVVLTPSRWASRSA